MDPSKDLYAAGEAICDSPTLAGKEYVKPVLK
jgi:hypothetical protein